MKLGIDIGNYQVKTSEGVIFDSRVSTEKVYGSSADVLKIGDEIFYVGEGEFDIEARKFDKKSYIPLLLTAICKSTESEVVDLGLGLPVLQYTNPQNIKDLKALLQGQEYDVNINGQERYIKIRSVEVFPEGVSGFLYLLSTDKELRDAIGDRDIVVVDIGGKTSDMALMKNKRATLPNSEDVGTIDIYDTICKELKTIYFDAKVESEKIQDYLDNGFFYKGMKQNIQFAINKTKELFDKIYKQLKLNYPITTEAVVILGGGAKLLGGEFRKNIPGAIVRSVASEDIFCNANAYKCLI